MAARVPFASNKIAVNLREMKQGTLHSGSKTGPTVTNPKQAIAIGEREARKKGRSTSTAGAARLPFQPTN